MSLIFLYFPLTNFSFFSCMEFLKAAEPVFASLPLAPNLSKWNLFNKVTHTFRRHFHLKCKNCKFVKFLQHQKWLSQYEWYPCQISENIFLFFAGIGPVISYIICFNLYIKICINLISKHLILYTFLQS